MKTKSQTFELINDATDCALWRCIEDGRRWAQVFVGHEGSGSYVGQVIRRDHKDADEMLPEALLEQMRRLEIEREDEGLDSRADAIEAAGD